MKQQQPVRTASPASLAWWVALCSLLLVLFASTLQATHFHRVPVRSQQQAALDGLYVGSPLDSDNNCPLCVSSGSALPVGVAGAPFVLRVYVEGLLSRRGRLVPTVVHFTQAMRPPPCFA